MAMHSVTLELHSGQVAGHGDLLIDRHFGRVYKRLDPIEVRFYHLLQENASSLIPFTAQFFGTSKTAPSAGSELQDFIVLEDLLKGMKRPCVMDVKIGKITYLPNMSSKKIEECKQKALESTQFTDAFRICGMQVIDAKTGKTAKHGKAWGKKVKSSHLAEALQYFLDNGTQIRSDVLEYFIERLTALEMIIRRDFRGWKFVSSSLLFVYDADDRVEGSNRPSLRADVRMIDFAHTLPPSENMVSEEEVGYLEGLSKLLSIFKSIRGKPKPTTYSAVILEQDSTTK